MALKATVRRAATTKAAWLQNNGPKDTARGRAQSSLAEGVLPAAIAGEEPGAA